MLQDDFHLNSSKCCISSTERSGYRHTLRSAKISQGWRHMQIPICTSKQMFASVSAAIVMKFFRHWNLEQEEGRRKDLIRTKSWPKIVVTFICRGRPDSGRALASSPQTTQYYIWSWPKCLHHDLTSNISYYPAQSGFDICRLRRSPICRWARRYHLAITFHGRWQTVLLTCSVYGLPGPF